MVFKTLVRLTRLLVPESFIRSHSYFRKGIDSAMGKNDNRWINSPGMNTVVRCLDNKIMHHVNLFSEEH